MLIKVSDMEKKEDRRIRKTKKAMYDALAALLSSKPLNRISVREIAELADINRGTFYLHYRDVYDMVNKLQEEIFEKFSEIVDNNIPASDGNVIFPMLAELFNLLAENSNIAGALIGKNGDAAFIDRLRSVIKEKCFVNAQKILKTKNNNEFEFFLEYIISGCMGLCSAWLEKGMKEDISKMAHYTEQFILNGAKTFTK